MIGRTDDRFLVLDDEQGVAFVSQVVHHAHKTGDIAGMKTNTRLVHDKQGVHERGAKTGGQVYALHFATAQRARRAVESQVTEADLAQVPKSGDDFVA